MNIPKEVEEAIKKRAEELYPQLTGVTFFQRFVDKQANDVQDLIREAFITGAREFYLMGMQDKNNCELFFQEGWCEARPTGNYPAIFERFYAQRFNKQ